MLLSRSTGERLIAFIATSLPSSVFSSVYFSIFYAFSSCSKRFLFSFARSNSLFRQFSSVHTSPSTSRPWANKLSTSFIISTGGPPASDSCASIGYNTDGVEFMSWFYVYTVPPCLKFCPHSVPLFFRHCHRPASRHPGSRGHSAQAFLTKTRPLPCKLSRFHRLTTVRDSWLAERIHCAHVEVYSRVVIFILKYLSKIKKNKKGV